MKRFLSEVRDGVVPQTYWSWKEVGSTRNAKRELSEILEAKSGDVVFDTPKPTRLLGRIVQITMNAKESDIAMDFFAGSCSLGHALIEANANDGGNRRFVLVQIGEPIEGSRYDTIASLGIDRLLRAGRAINSDAGCGQEGGFRVLKIDSSNFKDIRYRPDDITQTTLLDTVDHVKEGRTDEDLLFQVLLSWGVDLGLPIAPEDLLGHRTFFVDTDALAACFEIDLDEAYVKALAVRKPLRVVFRDGAFGGDAGQINVVQLFRQLSPDTEVKVL